MTEEQSLSQTAEKTTNNAKSERQQPLRPAMALAIHGNEDGKKNDGGVSSPKSGSSKGMFPVYGTSDEQLITESKRLKSWIA